MPREAIVKMRYLIASLILFGAGTIGAQQTHNASIPSTSVIVDTDAGPDDLMAIAFLLASPAVHVEAICIGTGLAHIRPGATNILKLLELAGRRDIPVYMGRDKPLSGDRQFPAEWRALSDKLAGVTLPKAKRLPESRPAAEFLAERLADATRPVELLALGGLTNLGEAFASNPGAIRAIRHLVIMGGAVRVPGNLGAGGVTGNSTAEYNIYVDPEAARRVFASGAPIRLIPLDATNRVPIDSALVRELQRSETVPLARVVSQVLKTVKTFIDDGSYFAWDPLAAVALVDPSVVTLESAAIAVRQQAPEEGRTVVVPGAAPNAQIAVDANALKFRQIFVGTLRRNDGARPATS